MRLLGSALLVESYSLLKPTSLIMQVVARTGKRGQSWRWIVARGNFWIQPELKFDAVTYALASTTYVLAISLGGTGSAAVVSTDEPTDSTCAGSTSAESTVWCNLRSAASTTLASYSSTFSAAPAPAQTSEVNMVQSTQPKRTPQPGGKNKNNKAKNPSPAQEPTKTPKPNAGEPK